jgi:hypothetical protein
MEMIRKRRKSRSTLHLLGGLRKESLRLNLMLVRSYNFLAQEQGQNIDSSKPMSLNRIYSKVKINSDERRIHTSKSEAKITHPSRIKNIILTRKNFPEAFESSEKAEGELEPLPMNQVQPEEYIVSFKYLGIKVCKSQTLLETLNLKK